MSETGLLNAANALLTTSSNPFSPKASFLISSKEYVVCSTFSFTSSMLPVNSFKKVGISTPRTSAVALPKRRFLPVRDSTLPPASLIFSLICSTASAGLSASSISCLESKTPVLNIVFNFWATRCASPTSSNLSAIAIKSLVVVPVALAAACIFLNSATPFLPIETTRLSALRKSCVNCSSGTSSARAEILISTKSS